MGTTTFVWDPVFDCVTHELDENNNVKAEYHNEPQQYGGVLSQRRGTTSHYHHHDALGSTRFLTDSSGNVTDTYLHDAWGNLIASTGTTVNPFKWVGKYGYYTDNSTAQVYVRARMYQPTVARWVSVDPMLRMNQLTLISIETLYGFVYAISNPVSRHDQSGLLSLASNIAVESVVEEGLGNSSCPTISRISWSFKPTSPNGWPCDGHLAQLVNVSCQVSKCGELSCKVDSLYVETWRIAKGKLDVNKPDGEDGKTFTDTAAFFPTNKTWGYYLQTSQIVVLCNERNRGSSKRNYPYVTESEMKWLRNEGGVRTEDKKCPTSSGTLKGREISTNEERGRFETIWEKRFRNWHADRAFHVDWDCCCKPTEQFAEGRPMK